MNDEYMAQSGFCEDCHSWTWTQTDESPEAFQRPDYCGLCGGEVDHVNEYTIFVNGQSHESIRWMSDGPVLTLKDGTEVSPRIRGVDGEDWIPFEVHSDDGHATYGPEVDEPGAHLRFEGVDPDE